MFWDRAPSSINLCIGDWLEDLLSYPAQLVLEDWSVYLWHALYMFYWSWINCGHPLASCDMFLYMFYRPLTYYVHTHWLVVTCFYIMFYRPLIYCVGTHWLGFYRGPLTPDHIQHTRWEHHLQSIMKPLMYIAGVLLFDHILTIYTFCWNIP